jgi:hypothetical protein
MDNDDDATVLALESGLGADLAPSAGKWHPFVGALIGYLSISESFGFGQDNTHSEAYVGGTLGLRHFVKDYAATRMQIGYRRTLGDYFELGNLEIAGGVSFFL